MQLRFGAGFLPELDFWSSPPKPNINVTNMKRKKNVAGKSPPEPNINVTNMKNMAGKYPPELPPPPLLVGQTVFLATEQKLFQ